MSHYDDDSKEKRKRNQLQPIDEKYHRNFKRIKYDDLQFPKETFRRYLGMIQCMFLEDGTTDPKTCGISLKIFVKNLILLDGFCHNESLCPTCFTNCIPNWEKMMNKYGGHNFVVSLERSFTEDIPSISLSLHDALPILKFYDEAIHLPDNYFYDLERILTELNLVSQILTRIIVDYLDLERYFCDVRY